MTDKLWSSKKYHIKKQNHGKFSIEDGMIFAIPNKLPNKGLFYCKQKKYSNENRTLSRRRFQRFCK